MYLLLKMDDEPLYKRIIKAPRAVTPNEAFNDRVLLIQTFKKGIPVNGSDFISRKAINEEMRKEINARFKSWNKKITVAEIATLIFDVIENVKSIEEYRAFTEYYQTRLRNVWGYPAYWHEVHEVILKNGYAANAPKLLIKASLAVRTGREEWGAKPNEKYFVLIIHSVSEPAEVIKNIFDTSKNITIWKSLWRREE